MYNILTFKLN